MKFVAWFRGRERLRRRYFYLPGKVPVDFEDRAGLAWLRSIPPSFGARHRAAPAARLLGLETGDVEPRFPVEDVSTGIPFLFVPLASLEAVRKARPDGAAFDRHFGKSMPRPSSSSRGRPTRGRTTSTAGCSPRNPASRRIRPPEARARAWGAMS
jgi:hypothetical protein